MTRRDVTLLSAAFLASSAKAQKTTLPSKAFRFEGLVVKGNSRAVFDGLTHSGFQVDLHETDLAPEAATRLKQARDTESADPTPSPASLADADLATSLLQ